METISFDREGAVRIMNRSLACIVGGKIEKASNLLGIISRIKKVFEARGGEKLWTKEDKMALRNIGEELLCQANRYAMKGSYQEALDICLVFRAFAMAADGVCETIVSYVEGVAYEGSGDLAGARTSFTLGARFDPRCKKGLQRVGVKQRTGW